MNREQIEGNWMQIKGAAKKQWGKLTDDDLTHIEGDSAKLAGKIQERYGVAREEAERQIRDWRH